MKTTININSSPVEITLTPEQIAEIKEQIAETNKKPFHFTDINSFQDALDFRGETLEEFNARTQFDDDVQKAGKELEVLAFAIRGGKPLGTKKGDRWYYPVFNSKRSSVGFSYGDYRFVNSYSHVSSRLCVNNPDESKYFGEKFLPVWGRYINGSQLTFKKNG